jgi:hypothetical protein
MQTYGMFHVELRQFPHVARAFNQTRDELEQRFLAPWTAGAIVEWGDRKWAPERSRLTVLEGPELRPDEIGLGRGWANATRGGEDVTERVLARALESAGGGASLRALKQEVLGMCGATRVDVRETVLLASALHPELRVSDRLALAERAIWELLHEGLVTMICEDDGQSRPVASEQWQSLLLRWSTWGEQAAPTVSLEAFHS